MQRTGDSGVDMFRIDQKTWDDCGLHTVHAVQKIRRTVHIENDVINFARGHAVERVILQRSSKLSGPVLMLVYASLIRHLPRKATLIEPEKAIVISILVFMEQLSSPTSIHKRCPTSLLTRHAIPRTSRGTWILHTLLYMSLTLSQLFVRRISNAFVSLHPPNNPISYTTALTRWPAILNGTVDQVNNDLHDLTLQLQVTAAENDLRDQIQEGQKIVELLDVLKYRISNDMEMEYALHHIIREFDTKIR
jgi:hypothetical protein